MDGVNLVASAVAPTLGPFGSHVLIQRLDAPPLVTNDGVTIARSIEMLRDPILNQGVQLLRQASEQSESAVGDGTTTATVLARELLRGALQLVTAGHDPSRLAAEISTGVEQVARWLRERSEPLEETLQAIKDVASLAARDDQIAQSVAEALIEVGSDGVVRVEDSRTYGLKLEIIDGMRFSNGLAAPGLIVDQALGESAFDHPLIALAQERLTKVSQLKPLLEQAAAAQRAVILIADEISGDALTMLVLNVANRRIPVAAVKAPDFGPDRAAAMRDIAAWSGGELFGEEFGRTLAAARLSELGTVERAIINSDSTILIGGGGQAGMVSERAAGIRAELRITDSDYESTKLRVRLARLGGAVAVVGVGCDSQVEQEEVRHRVSDAVQAGKAALRSGMVPGGGAALAGAGRALFAPGDKRSPGQQILCEALAAPARQIALNAGYDAAACLSGYQSAGFGWGLDVRSGEWIDLNAAGIRDPLEVVVSALVSAASVARMGLLCEVIVAMKPLPKIRRPHHEHGHHYHGDPGGHSHGDSSSHSHSVADVAPG